MQIVIDITEEDLRIVKALVESGLATDSDVAIMNGTPLPKGHGRLIDADEVIKIANKKKDLHGAIWNATTIIGANTESEG